MHRSAHRYQEGLTARLVDAGKLTDPDSPRGRLLREAVHLFRSRGYERTTVRDIARAVGIQSGSIFHHFKSKEDILCSIMEETMLVTRELMLAALAQARTPRDKLQALIRLELGYINGEAGEALSVLFYEWRSLGDANRKRLLALREEYENLWLEVLDECTGAGLISLPPPLLRRFLAGALAWTFNWYDRSGPLDLDDLTDAALALITET